ncbi:MAG: sulfotransferase domain-containing protein [Okeania sp. SIO3B3]|nr:sulfotransferase domain-containing protein [Okeania sp. SIO3B3]
MLPNFIIIGAAKGGSIALGRYLDYHPEIAMQSPSEELDFFSENWDKGLSWYESHFQNSTKLQGERSPHYTYTHIWPHTAERMHSILPNIKLLYGVRDPIERLISHYVHIDTHGKYSIPLEEFVLNPDYYKTGCYFAHLSKFLQYYDRSQILVFPSEALHKNRQATLQTIFNFLGVAPDFYDEKMDQRIHVSTPMAKIPAPIAYTLSFVRKNNIQAMFPSSLRKQVHKWVHNLRKPADGKPTLPPEIRQQLVDIYTDDVAALRNFTGQDFAEWSL